MLRLRKILLCDKLFYFLLLIVLFYSFIYLSFYKVESNYRINDKNFKLIIKNYNIDGNKLTLYFDNVIGIYYFELESYKTFFIRNINLGDKIYINGDLSIPSNNTIPNTFNYKSYLEHNNIKYILNIKSYKKIKNNKNIFLRFKNNIYKRIDSINNEYLYAFILGKSSYINGESYDNYKTNGITHLFALSGLHVSLFSSFLLYLLNKLKVGEVKTFIITSLFLIFFSFIASFTPSILRATIFFILSQINKIYYFYVKPINLLYLTFIILLLINPNYLFNTGFLLSFCITFFIILFNEKKEGKKSIIKISILSSLASLPIIINLSHEINIIGFINNIFFIPYVSYIVFPVSLLILVFSKANAILIFFTIIMEKVSEISSNSLNVTLYFSHINLFLIIIYYIILIIVICNNKKKYKVIFIFLLVFIYIKPIFNKNIYVYFIDVGQGDSSLIVTKNNKSILIDTGGKIKYDTSEWSKRNRDYNLMKSSLIPFYKSIGLKKINYLILTHGDYDHMGDSINLVNNFKVEKVIFNCGEFNELENELIDVLKNKNIKYDKCIKELDVDNIKLSFLQTKYYDNENDNSNVIYTKINGYKFMFMGDAGIEKEKDILDKYNISNIDVLKIGHHGSKTSSSKEFINELNSNYSIISVGKNNRYGHPSKEVLNNLDNSKIYRTDWDGSITFKIKNNKLEIKTCMP